MYQRLSYTCSRHDNCQDIDSVNVDASHVDCKDNGCEYRKILNTICMSTHGPQVPTSPVWLNCFER